MQKETITLSHAGGIWYAKSDNPRVKELFGTDTLATAYTTKLDAVTVGERIQAKRPEINILFDFIL